MSWNFQPQLLNTVDSTVELCIKLFCNHVLQKYFTHQDIQYSSELVSEALSASLSCTFTIVSFPSWWWLLRLPLLLLLGGKQHQLSCNVFSCCCCCCCCTVYFLLLPMYNVFFYPQLLLCCGFQQYVLLVQCLANWQCEDIIIPDYHKSYHHPDVPLA